MRTFPMRGLRPLPWLGSPETGPTAPVVEFLSCVVLIVLVVLVPSSLNAATLSGQVTNDETEEALPFVDVVAIGLGQLDDVRRGDGTDQSGLYEIIGLPEGLYRVIASRIGYQAFSDTIQVREPAIVWDVPMKETAIPVAGVDIVGDRFPEQDTQTGFVNIDAERLQATPSIGEPDPIRILQLLPGVQAASDISSGLYIRGGGPDQTLVLLDQVPIYNPTHAFGFFSTFNADIVDDVTLYKGAYPAEYGGRLGAVLDVRNRDGSDTGLKGRGAISSLTSRLLLEGKAGERGRWLVSGRRTYLEPLLNALQAQGTDVPDYYFYDLNGKLRLEDKWGGRWVFSGYFGRDDLKFDLNQDNYIGLRWGNGAAAAQYTRVLSTSMIGNFMVSASEYDSNNTVKIFSTPILFGNRVLDLSARGDLTWEPWTKHRMSAGILMSKYEFAYDQEFNNSTEIDYKTNPFDVSLYVKDNWAFGDENQLMSGVRTRYFSDGDRFMIEPRLAFTRKLTDTVRMKIGGGMYNQYIQVISTEGFSAGDFYIPIDETAEPGRSIQGVLGFEYEPSLEYRFTAEGYYTDLSRLVTFDNTSAADQVSLAAADLFHTNGTGYATGVELFAERRLGAFTGWLGYTLGWTRRTFVELNEGKEFPPKYDRRHDINVVGAYRRGKWTYGTSFVYGTGQAFTPAGSLYSVRNPAEAQDEESQEVSVLPGPRNSARLLPYNRLDVSIARDFSLFGAPAQWVFQVFNLYSRRNEWFIQYNTEDLTARPEVVKMLPIIPSLGVSFDF